MNNNMSRYIISIDSKLLAKFNYIAEFELRTRNKQFEHIIKKHVRDFEKEHGKIDSEENNS